MYMYVCMYVCMYMCVDQEFELTCDVLDVSLRRRHFSDGNPARGT